jgi:hypothetical protein
MTDYQRRVRLTLTEVEARAIANAIALAAAGELEASSGWDQQAIPALTRAEAKLAAGRALAKRRNAEKAESKRADRHGRAE